VSTAPRKRLGRQDWVDAAVQMGTEQGFENLAVEPLAARLGATKGSFYWHFADRAALVSAVMSWWEQEATTSIIDRIDTIDQTDPSQALSALLAAALHGDPERDEGEWRLLAASADPQIGPVVARVHKTRVEYIERLLRSNGVDEETAHSRARVTYAGYLGLLTYRHATDEELDIDAIRHELLAMALPN
jgi:AcrR family transcriptional regulator